MEALARDFLPSDMRAEMQACGICRKRSGAGTADRLKRRNGCWSLAKKSEFIRGVVGWAPIASADFPRIALKTGADGSSLKGLRHVIQDEPDDEFILGNDFNAGISALAGTKLVYDILIFERHLPAAIKFVDRHPNQIFVLDHIAKPRIKDGVLRAVARESVRTGAARKCLLQIVRNGDGSEYGELDEGGLAAVFRRSVGGVRTCTIDGWLGLAGVLARNDLPKMV